WRRDPASGPQVLRRHAWRHLNVEPGGWAGVGVILGCVQPRSIIMPMRNVAASIRAGIIPLPRTGLLTANSSAVAASSTAQLERAWDAWQAERYQRGETGQRADCTDNPFRPR